MKQLNLFTILCLIISLTSCGGEKQTGIQGDSNSGNAVVLGEGNSVTVNNGMKPELYLTLSTEDETSYIREVHDKKLIYPLEEISLESSAPSDFSTLTSFRPNVNQNSLFSGHRVYIYNRGKSASNGVWFKIFFPAHIGVNLIGADNKDWDIGFNENRKANEVSYKPASFSIEKDEIKAPSFILTFKCQPIPGDYEVPYVIGNETGVFDERKLILKVRANSVSTAYIENARGLKDIEFQDYTNAIKHFENAVRVEGNVSGFWFNLGTAYLNIGDNQNGEKYLLSAVSKSKQTKDEYIIFGNLGAAYLKQNKCASAKEFIEFSLKLNSNDIDKHNLEMARLCLNGNKQPESKQDDDNLLVGTYNNKDNDNKVNLRESPNGKIIKIINLGEKFFFKNTGEQWIRVKTQDGYQGYIRADRIKRVE